MTSSEIMQKYNQQKSAKGQFAYLHVGLGPADTTKTLNSRFKIKSGNTTYEALLELEDSSKISYSFENEYEYPIDTLTGKTQSTADLVVQAIQAGSNVSQNAVSSKSNMDSVFTSIYKSVPAYKGTSVLKIPDTLTFTFYAGQRGLMDGLSEVVIPILCLASYFLPSRTRNGGSLTNLPFPTSPSFLSSAMASLLTKPSLPPKPNSIPSSVPSQYQPNNTDTDAAENANDELNGKINSGNSFTKIADTIVSKLDSAVTDNYSPKKFCALELCGNYTTKNEKGENVHILGALRTPVFYVGKIGFSFDMSEQINGYPMSGKLSLMDIQTPRIANKDDIQLLRR